MAYLITCAGSKNKPLDFNPSTLDQLSNNNILLQSRQLMIDLTGVHLDWNHTLPAWQLYRGTRSKIYPQISEQNWNKSCVEIKILSALFGWINHMDLIPYYDLRMTDRRGVANQQIWRIWYNMKILSVIVNPNDIDLLSQDYRKAITGKKRPVGIVPPNVCFNDYGIKKGKWLNNELNNLTC